LRHRLAQWLNLPASEALPMVNESEWTSFVNEVSKELNLGRDKRLGDILESANSPQLLEAIRQLEICLGNRTEVFRRAASSSLHQIYHQVFRVPPMESQNLIPVALDPVRRATEITSEIEILSLDHPLNVRMGKPARDERNQAIAQSNSNSSKEILGKFHQSCKRYFGDNRSWNVKLDGQEKEVHVNDLIQGAWAHLIKLSEQYRQQNPGRFAEGDFERVVVTYPTKASPAVRSDIEKLIKDLGYTQVQTAYDEAVSVAIFFLWREFGGDLNIGIESFKTRCRYDGEKWSQNVLVLDIGGGTTDIALISLTLEEKEAFGQDEDRGAGGRYYVLTPKLLRSSGHPQLGGELITLRLFRLLKVALADTLLTAVTQETLKSETLETRIGDLNPDRFLNNGKFRSGSLLACIDKENPETDPGYQEALNAAEKILPTRWEKESQRLQTFYTLWEQAETAKLFLGQKPGDGNGACLTFVLSEADISELLNQSNITFEVKDPNSLRVEINRQQFEQAATPVITEAIGIAKGLVLSELGNQTQTPSAEKKRVDWLILSGKTCNLYLVEREIYQEFSGYDYFLWNPERITFVPQYTKIATSAGACYAERLLQYGFNLEAAKESLRLGSNQLDIDVKNLFYFLPCSFKLKTQDSSVLLPIFKAGQQLYQLDVEPQEESVAKVRSDWRSGVQLFTTIYRQDFEGMTPQLWGNYNGNKLASQLNMESSEVKDKIRVRFEIDHKLRFSLLLCQGNPHYWIGEHLPSLDLGKALGTQGVIADGKVVCDIAVYVIESRNTIHKTDTHHLVFEGGKDYSQALKVFRYENGANKQGMRGLISAPLPPFPRNGKHTFYFRHPNTDDWMLIGEARKTEFPCKYYVTLDEQGILRIHAGEVCYWSAKGEEDLKQEGCVFKADLDLQPNEVDKDRDPFCGIH
ncbi:MAG: molecular chaperone, partial [Moorea sp. SIO2B7]|nr:molecular chaperone [Moorena sp. SIO2B7]